MWFVGLRNVWSRNMLRWTRHQNIDRNAPDLCLIGTGWMVKRSLAHPYYSTLEAVKCENDGKMTLAKNLACLVGESSSSNVEDSKPNSRVEVRRLCELRIKKRVKEQYVSGKFRNILYEVIANPKTLNDAYNSIKANSNVDNALMGDSSISIESMAKEICSGNFDVQGNVYSISTRGVKKEVLVLPNLKLKIVQEAIRIALDVIYRPLFFKTSHGCRSGRGHFSALKYVCKEISNPDWWFPLVVSKKLDSSVLTKLISIMETRIEDAALYNFLKEMFDADVLNLEFGGFHKGHGLPQEGVLSPILMNIYLDLFDSEVYRLSMQYETLGDKFSTDTSGSQSKLRSWFRRQMNGNNANSGQDNIRVHTCRFMDEIFVAISGSKDTAIAVKNDIQSYVLNSLLLDVDDKIEIFPCNGRQGVRFLGTLLKRSVKDGPAVRAVHKLKEKVKLFASQKREAWDEGTVIIGKKWVSHGLKKVKESEIKHLADSSSVLSQISRFRKAGMETDHWYKVLVKIWMQEINAKSLDKEEHILSKHIAEPALPKELRDSFYKFQKCAEEYVSSETSAILALMPNPSPASESLSVTEIVAPVNVIKKRLSRYGLINAKGIPHTCHLLILQDADQIIDWFSGIAYRWLRWYSQCNNLSEVKGIIDYHLRKSCIRTLAAKYRIHESEIAKRFDAELSRIPSSHESENEMENEGVEFGNSNGDEALMYGISYSGLCLLSLARIVSSSRPCTCFVMGCETAAPCVYTLHVMERQKFPGWKTGFSTCIHPSLQGRRIGLCKQHLKDLYLGHISLQSIDFGAWK